MTEKKRSHPRRRRPSARAASQPPLRLGLWGRLRTWFFTGILVTAPLAITLYIAILVLDTVDSWVTPLIPDRFNPSNYLPFNIPGLGLLLAILLLTLIGAVAASLIGRFFVRMGDRLVARMPVIGNIYGAVKQLVDAVFSSKASAFRQVVLLEWPREGAWTIGFLTSKTAHEIDAKLGHEMCTVMVPTTPNPTSGYLVFLPRKAVIPLDMTIEHAMKIVLSSGIVLPPGEAALLASEAAEGEEL